MSQIYVSLDLETTGLKPETDGITEIGAVKFSEEGVIDTFHTMVNPHQPLPYHIRRLTGITQQELTSAPSFPSIATELIAFVDNHLLIGQSLDFDLQFLSCHGIRFTNTVYDTLEMAKLLLPRLTNHSLASLAKHLQIPYPVQHRALSDAMVTKDVFLALVEKTRQLDLSLISEIVRLMSGTGWSLLPLLLDIETWKMKSISAEKGSHRISTEIDFGLFASRTAEPKDKKCSSPTTEPLDVERLDAILKPGGTLARSFPEFELRQCQLSMMHAVASALNSRRNLIVEAGTGTGKSIAYLLPSIIFALQNGTPIVVSTNTINLQEQLMTKDIPLLLSALGLSSDLHPVRLKGRGNYLCLRRWNSLLKAQELSIEEARFLARTLVWLSSPSTGDVTELNISRDEFSIWSKICAGADNCLEGQCGYRKRGECFLYRAHQDAEGALLIVVNHALLLSDAVAKGRIIPPYHHLIIDEAHHLEEAATEQLGFKLSSHELLNHFAQLSRKTTGKSYTGLIAEFTRHLGSTSISSSRRREIEKLADELHSRLETVPARVSHLIDELWDFFEYHAEGEGDYERRLRLTTEIRLAPPWGKMLAIWEPLKEMLTGIELELSQFYSLLDESPHPELPNYDNLMVELSSSIYAHTNLFQHMDSIIAQPCPDKIYWLSMRRQEQEIILHAAPLHVGRALQESLFSQKDCIILTGATLSTEGNFDYIRWQLDMEEADTLSIGSPFDYQKLAMLYIPSDMVELGRPGRQKALSEALIALCRATEGRTLVLFTSHSSLRAAYAAIQEPLADDDILVLGQGIDGSPKHLLDIFKDSPRTALLGASSLWEGIDVVGPALSTLVITRLPFGVPTDPISAARSEMFDNAFTQYALPQAILKFRQGFGRLIRSKTDRGVAVILDTRVQTKYYGRAFLESLPPCTVKMGSMRDMPAEVVSWLKR